MAKFSGNTSSSVMMTRSKAKTPVHHTRSRGGVAGPSLGLGVHRNAEAGPSKPKRARCDTNTLKKKQDKARAAAQTAQKKEKMEEISMMHAYVYVGNVTRDVDMGALGTLFRDCGRVLKVELRCTLGSVADGKRGGFYATVLFRSIRAAVDALSLNGSIVRTHGGGFCKIKVTHSAADLRETKIVERLPLRSLRKAVPVKRTDTLILPGAQFNEPSLSQASFSSNAQAGPSRQRTVKPLAQMPRRVPPVTDSTLIPVPRHNKVGLFGVSWKYAVA